MQGVRQSFRQSIWGRWIAFLLIGVLILGVVYVVLNRTVLLGQLSAGGTATATTDTATTDTATTDTAAQVENSTGEESSQLPTVAIEPADLLDSAVSASGNLALVSKRSVALDVAGIVNAIDVAVSDRVAAGDRLLQLDTTDLERALALAELNVESARLALADLQEPATAAEVAQAEAALVEARENLADVKAGPSAAEIAAARSSLAAAQSSYSELQAGPSDAELTQLSADLKKAEIALQEAQGAYDKVAWQGNASSQSADLQSATIDYESVKAAYEETTAPAATSALQSASSSIQDAQVKLEELLNSPTAVEIATAEAQVAEAEAALADLQKGPTHNDVRSAQISLEQALIELEVAIRDLAAATITAPVAGVVIGLNAEIGVHSAADSVVVTLSDPQQLELAISVAESDIPNVAIGQQAEIEVDALPGKRFAGVVTLISPINDSDASAVKYPVTVRLTGDALTGVMPGMNAVATLASQDKAAADSWLVPTNALRTEGGSTTVMRVRGEIVTPVGVTAGTVQGEWTTVQSTELQEGDQVVGSLTSNLDSDSFFGGASGPPPGAGMAVPRGGQPRGRP